MPHRRTSCRGRYPVLVRLELQHLYAELSSIDTAIRQLERLRETRQPHREPATLGSLLEFSSKPCNLTNCGSA